MLSKLKFHHIGIATADITKTSQNYRELGFISTKVIFDIAQSVNICFLKKTGSPLIELVEPVNANSPVQKIIKKNGTTPYHICYQTSDIISTIQILRKLEYILIQKPTKAPAINNHNISFLFNKALGLIELVEINER